MAAATQEQNNLPILDTSTKPSAIEQDIKEMERRKRVENIMHSQMFREELERIIEDQFVVGSGSLAGLSALQQVTELLKRGGFTSSTLTGGSSVIPINDLRGIEAVKYKPHEKLLRCKTAATYRLVDLYGWSQNIYNHISQRIDEKLEHFLINPFGLQYSEITASSLVKIDIQGNLIDQGSTNFLFNRAGFNLHASIHRARPDLHAIIHIHHAPVVAVSTYKKGLLPLCQEAAILGDVSYYDYTGILVDSNEQDDISRALGIHNKVMILRNHGVIACGTDMEEALFWLTNVVKACEVQVKLLPVGLENLVLMSTEAIERTRETVKHSAVVGKDGDGSAEKQTNSGTRRKINIKEMDFEAQMRMLDNAGYRTGYVYKNPLIRKDERSRHDIEEPPTATSVQSDYFDQDKWLSPLKKLVDGKKTHDRIAWVNSPNVYQRKEILETGTHDPRVITRWIQDGQAPNGQHYEHAKIDSAHQFAPHSLDVEEFKRKQKAMKELRLKNTISSGPQSQILDGVTWDELKQTSDGDGSDGQRAAREQTIIVGAASKGIIQRDHQHDAKMYKTAYAKNPFDKISDAELEEYKRIVTRKQRGEDVPLEDIPENMRHLLKEPLMELATGPASPTSPLSDDESEKDKKRKDKEKKKKIRTPSFLRGGKTTKLDSKDESERVDKDEKKEKDKKKEKREKERA